MHLIKLKTLNLDIKFQQYLKNNNDFQLEKLIRNVANEIKDFDYVQDVIKQKKSITKEKFESEILSSLQNREILVIAKHELIQHDDYNIYLVNDDLDPYEFKKTLLTDLFEKVQNGELKKSDFEILANAKFMNKKVYKSLIEAALKKAVSELKDIIRFTDSDNKVDDTETRTNKTHSSEIALKDPLLKKTSNQNKRSRHNDSELQSFESLRELQKSQKKLDQNIQEERLQQEREFANEMKQLDKSKDEKFLLILKDEVKRQDNLRQAIHDFYSKHQSPVVKSSNRRTT